MLLTINYLTTQQNHLRCTSNKIELKLNVQTLHWEIKLFHQSNCLGIIISVKIVMQIYKDRRESIMQMPLCFNINVIIYCSPEVTCCMFKSYCSTIYCISM